MNELTSKDGQEKAFQAKKFTRLKALWAGGNMACSRPRAKGRLV